MQRSPLLLFVLPNVFILILYFLETAMGIKKEENEQAGFDYAMAVMRYAQLNSGFYRKNIIDEYLFQNVQYLTCEKLQGVVTSRFSIQIYQDGKGTSEIVRHHPQFNQKGTNVLIYRCKNYDIAFYPRQVIKRKKSEYLERVKDGNISFYSKLLSDRRNEKDHSNGETGKQTTFDNGSSVRDDLDENDENDIGGY